MEWLSFRFELTSFILGFVTASVFWWLLNHLSKSAPAIVRFFKGKLDHWRQTNFSNIDRYLRLDVQKRAQRNHLANPIFSLNEILIEPRIMVPFGIDAQSPHHTRPLSATLIPYHPDWPEVTTQYPYPSFSIAQAIQNHAHLAIIGPAGCGKTVTLAHLANLLAAKDPKIGKKNTCFPLYLNVNEVTIPTLPTDDPLAQLVAVVVARSPLIIQKRIPAFLKNLAGDGNLIVILDGLDELHPQYLTQYVSFLKALINTNPKIQVVVSASSEYFDGILQIGFTPLTLASWNAADREAFITTWGEQWIKLVAPQLQKSNPVTIDSMVINNWIEQESIALSPLEWTLRLWSFYSGDLAGSSNLQAISSYLDRCSRGIVSREILQFLALGFFSANNIGLAKSEVENFLSRTNSSQQPTLVTSPTGEVEGKSPGSKKGSKVSNASKIIESLVRTGLLVEFTGGVISFSHPVITGFLVSSNAPEPANATGSNKTFEVHWLVAELTLHYQAAQGQAVEFIEGFIYSPQPPLFENFLRVCRWIKDVPVNLPWRTHVMRQLTQLLHREDLPFSIRSRFLSALACTNDPSVPVLLRQLLASQSASVRLLAALGSGALQDDKSLQGLTKLLADPTPEVRLTAAFAIGALRAPASLAVVEELLKSGDENLSQVAAECLAANPDDGYDLLKSAAESDQILVRRAAVIGLAQIHQDWAATLIEKLAVQDGQWVVRNVAGQTLETLKHPLRLIPTNPVPAHDSPWLLELASQSGEGIPVGDSGQGILLKALQSGTVEQKIAALDYLRRIPSRETIQAVELAARDTNREVEQAAVNTLAFFAMSGTNLTH